MSTLRISPGLSLPPEAVTQTFGVLAVRGASKTNTATVMAEEMFAAGLPFVVVDPVGAWWGLRSSSDGKGPGLALPIFGGRRGDVPLEKTGGQLIADVIVDERLSCVLDVSEFSEGEKIRFLVDFAERLYRRNEDPLHLFLEEADDYAPQRPMREQARLLRSFENIVRRGRARGLGITMISQRSAALNKNLLTQIETLIAMRTTSPQDRKAIEGWVEYHGQAKELLESLPSLKDGEAWVWSPHWLGQLERVQIRRRSTFDSAATPKDVKGRRPPASLADVDLGSLQKRMADTIERAKETDPRELQGKIRRLQGRIRELEASASKSVETVEVPVEVPVLTPENLQDLENLQRSVWAALDRFEAAATSVQEGLEPVIGPLASILSDLEDAVAAGAVSTTRAARAVRGEDTAGRRPADAGSIPAPRSKSPATKAGASVGRPDRGGRAPGTGRDGRSPDEPTASAAGDFRPSSSQQRILDALAWLDSVGIPEAKKTQLALLAEQSPRSSGYTNNLGALRSAGLIDYPLPGMVTLTEAGRSVAAVPELPPTTEALQRSALARLPKSQGRILRALIAVYPQELGKAELAERADQSPTSSGYTNNLGALRSLGLIDYPSSGWVVALPVLFLEER